MTSGGSAKQMTLPQIAVCAAAGIGLLWFLTFLYWMVAGADSLDTAERNWRTAEEKRRKEESLISKEKYWRQTYETARARMPEFEEGSDLSTHWLDLVGRIAADNGLEIKSIKSIRGKEGETSVGDVFEQQIEIGKWEATLENLVRTMYAFQTAEGQMIDIRKMTVQPNSARRGFVGGSLVLTCAYTRRKPAKTVRTAPAPAAAGAAAGKENK